MAALREHGELKHKDSVKIKDAFYKLYDGILKVDITNLKCKLCSKEMKDIDSLMMHLKEEHDQPVNFKYNFGVMPFKQLSDCWICVYCHRKFPNFNLIKRHMPNHFQNYTCQFCTATFMTENALRVHLKMEKCTLLNKGEERFTYQLQYRRNAEIIIECSTAYPFRTWSGKFSCIFCRDLFSAPAFLRHHMNSRHEQFDTYSAFYKCLGKDFLKIDITELKCKLCLTALPDVETLVEHLKEGHGKPIVLDSQMGVLPFKLNTPPWKCLYCPHESNDFRSLARHTSRHFQNYVCDICGEGFISEQRLNAHYKKPHENVFSCYRCSATFSTAEDRKQHIKTRHTNTPYMCLLCKNKPRFGTWDARQKHLHDLHDIKPTFYECNECNATFKTRSAKYKHVQKKHSIKQFQCEQCNSVFTSKLILENHIAKKHSDDD